jgi:hypothetical protein
MNAYLMNGDQFSAIIQTKADSIQTLKALSLIEHCQESFLKGRFSNGCRDADRVVKFRPNSVFGYIMLASVHESQNISEYYGY